MIPPRFSRRAETPPDQNRLTRARQRRLAAGASLVDLTNSNPTQAGLEYPLEELSEVMARAARAPYEPQAFGLLAAREAVARELECSADDILLTASTSEAYSFLFKLLCDPGDSVITPVPAYPLFEHLAAVESVALQHVPMEFHRRWEIDPDRVAGNLEDRTRSIMLVSPNNPAGSYVTQQEQEGLARCGLPLISDEVFHAYAFVAPSPSLVRDDVLSFTLGGLSKFAGLPHFKLAWIRVSGPQAVKEQAMARLELIADSFLSASTPVQVALPELLTIAPRIRAQIMGRVRSNLRSLQSLFAAKSSARLLPVEGGWSAVLRVPSIQTDEAFALQLLEEEGVIVQPGYFFDFPSEGHLVLSLLTEPDVLAEGAGAIASRILQ